MLCVIFFGSRSLAWCGHVARSSKQPKQYSGSRSSAHGTGKLVTLGLGWEGREAGGVGFGLVTRAKKTVLLRAAARRLSVLG